MFLLVFTGTLLCLDCIYRYDSLLYQIFMGTKCL
nr:MAG TPA: hypothetical protein [Caudoviricetes sp.]